MTMIHPHETAKIAAVDQIESKHATLDQLQDEHARFLASATEEYSDAIEHNCRTDFRARRSSGTRPLSEINLFVVHCTQGFTARAAASWFANPDSQGSAHSVSDDNVCFATLNDNEIPWGAPGANYHGYHAEQAGFVSWTQALWSTKHRNTLKRTAYRAAVRCKRYDIPRYFRTAADLKAGKKGITTHAECTKAYGGDHTDPGPNWPRRLFMFYVRYYYARLGSEV
jgi:hypothetical protein